VAIDGLSAEEARWINPGRTMRGNPYKFVPLVGDAYQVRVESVTAVRRYGTSLPRGTVSRRIIFRMPRLQAGELARRWR